MKRKGTATWTGGLKTGRGALSTESGVLSKTPYSFTTRFEDEIGTNPEELIAAAHAGCFTMDLSNRLEHVGLTAENICTTASLTLSKLEHGFTISGIHLDVVAKIPGADTDTFNSAVENARESCPVSRVLNTTITVDARLVA